MTFTRENKSDPGDFYRIIADNTGDMERWISPEKKLLYISPSCEKITGYTQEEHMQNPELLMNIIHPKDRDRFITRREESFSGNLLTEDYVRIITKQGEIRWLYIVAHKVRDDAGNDLGFRTSSRDITDIKELEFKLKQNNALYSRVVEDQVDLVLRHNANGICTFANRSFASFFGLQKEEIPGSNWRDWSSPEEFERTEKLNAKLTVTSPVQRAVFEYRKENKEKVFIEWIVTGIFDDSGNLAEQQVIGRDVTDNVVSNQKLKISEDRYKALVESQNEIVVKISPEGQVLFVNGFYAWYKGFPSDHFIGKPGQQFAGADFISAVQRLIMRLNPYHFVEWFESTIIRHDGMLNWFSFTVKGLFDEDGRLSEVLLVGHNINELKETTERLQKSLLELNELKKQVEQENVYMKDKFVTPKSIRGIVSNSPLMQEVVNKIKQVSMTDSPVLLMGETGTGKEVIAHAIHSNSPRRNRLMITVNCGALPPSLMESELFGREKGAYTGALSRQIGRFELAHKSTIFLDEIGEIPFDLQVKLLRVIQTGEFQMLGNPETKKVDVRIIAATNRNLNKALDEGLFRKDLFYRLSVFPIDLPPLRERKEDIPSLAFEFISDISQKMGKTISKITNESMNRLLGYSWPGNIRELRNIIEYSIIMCNGSVLEIIVPEEKPATEVTFHNLAILERNMIVKVLEETGWRVRGREGTAEKLGIRESTLRYRMKKLGIERKK